MIEMGNRRETENYFRQLTQSMLEDMPDYVKDYARSIHHSVSPRTLYEYLKDIGKFLRYASAKGKKYPALSELDILDKACFENYLIYLERYEEDGKERTNDRASLKRKLSALRQFFDYLFQNGLTSNNEIRKVGIPKVHKKQIVRMENKEAADFLGIVENGTGLSGKALEYHGKQALRDTAICALMLSTGIRVSECAELDVNDVDLRECAVHITRKGGDESIVYFSDETADRLRDWLIQRQVMRIPKEETALFLSSRNRRMGVRAMEYMVKKYARIAVPMKHITPHKLRATYATQLYQATGDIYMVADALGHKDVKTTKEHYADLTENRKKQHRNAVSYKKNTGTDVPMD